MVRITLIFCRVGKRDAAEHFVQLAALAVHALHLPAAAVHQVDDLLGQLGGLRFVLRIDAEAAVEPFDAAELGEVFLVGAARRQRHRAGQRGHAAQLLRSAVGHDAAAVDDDGARAGGVDFLEDMGREHDRLAAPELADQVPDLVLLVRIEAVGGLVHDEHVRVVDQRLREAGAVLVALRQRVDRLVQHRLQEAQLHHAGHGFTSRRAGQAAQLGGETEESLHRHVGIGGGVLRQVADEALRLQRLLAHVVAADGDAPRAGRHEAGDHAHGGRLAGAVGAEEAEHLAALHREGDVVHRALGAERLYQVFDFDHGL
jgi:hypothetical protein